MHLGSVYTEYSTGPTGLLATHRRSTGDYRVRAKVRVWVWVWVRVVWWAGGVGGVFSDSLWEATKQYQASQLTDQAETLTNPNSNTASFGNSDSFQLCEFATYCVAAFYCINGV